jgi:ATP-dependent Clp protease protease subunit
MWDRAEDEEEEDEPTEAPAAPPEGPSGPRPEGQGMVGLAEKLFKTRQVQLFGPVDDKLAARVISQVLALEADDAAAPITVLVNSPGGSVSSGFAIYDMLRFVTCPVRIVCTGLCASIATVILMAAPKEQRLALPNTRLLIHQPLIPGQVYGPASDLEITANELLKTRAKINLLLATECGQPLERLESDTQRDYWMTATEAVTYGLIARVVERRADLG